MKKLSAPLVLFFSLLLCLTLGSTSALSASKRSTSANARPTDVVPLEIQNNGQIRPYLPQRNLLQIYESRSSCNFDGKHADERTEYGCIDYRSNDSLWRVVFGPGSQPTISLARKVFKKDRGNWVLLAEFDNEARLVSESPSGTKVRIALGGGQNEAPQANGNENASPLQGVIPPELRKLLPGLGTLLGK
jgi:hypothetical protein